MKPIIIMESLKRKKSWRKNVTSNSNATQDSNTLKSVNNVTQTPFKSYDFLTKFLNLSYRELENSNLQAICTSYRTSNNFKFRVINMNTVHSIILFNNISVSMIVHRNWKYFRNYMKSNYSSCCITSSVLNVTTTILTLF